MTITAMGNTFSCLNVHGVFSTKERIPTPEVRERLWPDPAERSTAFTTFSVGIASSKVGSAGFSPSSEFRKSAA